MTIAHIAVDDEAAISKVNQAIDKANQVDSKATQTALNILSEAVAIKAAQVDVASLGYEVDILGEAIDALPTMIEAASPLSRPGEPGDYYGTNQNGSPSSIPTHTDKVASANGNVAVLTNSGVVARKVPVRYEPARQYRGRFVVQRVIDSLDPSNDTVRLGVACLRANYSTISDLTFEDLTDFTVSNGRTQRIFDIPADSFTPPAGTVYLRPYVRSFGFSGQIYIEVIDILDMEDVLTWSPDVTAFEAELAAQQAQIDALEAPYVSRLTKYDVGRLGAHPDLSASVNTGIVQQAIQDGHDEGMAEVYLPFASTGVYKTQASTDTTMLTTIAADHTYTSAAASTLTSLLLKSGVYLILDDGVTIENQNPAINCISTILMESGGVIGGHIKSVWDWADQTPGIAGHGIFTFCSTNANNDPNSNLRFEDIEISHVASYGLGMQLGYMKFNRANGLWIHDVGADCIDWKARPKSDGTPPVGNIVENILGERYGRRDGITASTVIDIRGALQAEKIFAREAAYGSQNNVGIRASAGISLGVDKRQSSASAIVSGFNLDAGDPTIAGTQGLVLLDSGAVAENGFVTNFDTGVSIVDSSTGWGSNALSQINNVHVEAARARSFDVVSSRVSVIGCSASGQVETFEATKGNLSNAQTLFTSPRHFDTGTVQVYKNDTLLTLTTDYEVTSDTKITLVSGVGSTDVLQIVSPSPEGFYITGKNCELVNVRTRFVTRPRFADGVRLSTLKETGVLDEGLPFVSVAATSSVITEEARGAAANVEREIVALGNSGITLRNRGGRRAFRAANQEDNAVNWVEVWGSADGNPTTISAQGTSTDIGMVVRPKNEGTLQAFHPQFVSRTAPNSPTDTGGKGEFRFDNQYIYLAYDNDKWLYFPAGSAPGNFSTSYADRAAAVAGGVTPDTSGMAVQSYSATVDTKAGRANYRLAVNDTEYNAIDSRLKMSVSGKKFVIADHDIDITAAGANPASSASINALSIIAAMSSRSVLGTAIKAVVPGTYLVDQTIYIADANGIDFYIGAGVTIKGTAGLNGKLFDLRGSTVRVHGTGMLDGSAMPNSPPGSAYDILGVIGDDIQLDDIGFYSGDDYTTAGADSQAFLAGSRIVVRNTRHYGAKDLGIYITDRVATADPEQRATITGSSFFNCNNAAAAKRGFQYFKVDKVHVKGCKNGIYTGEVTDGSAPGTTAKYFSCTKSSFEAVTDAAIIARVTDGFNISGNEAINCTGTNIIAIQGSSYGICSGNTITIDPAVYTSPNTQRGILLDSRLHTDGNTYNSTHNIVDRNIIRGVYTPVLEHDAAQDYNNFVDNDCYGYGITGTTGVSKAGPHSTVSNRNRITMVSDNPFSGSFYRLEPFNAVKSGSGDAVAFSAPGLAEGFSYSFWVKVTINQAGAKVGSGMITASFGRAAGGNITLFTQGGDTDFSFLAGAKIFFAVDTGTQRAQVKMTGETGVDTVFALAIEYQIVGGGA